MKSLLESRLNMFDAVIGFCEANTDTTTTVPAFGTAFTAFKAKVTQIKAKALDAGLDITGVAANKAVLKTALALEAFRIAKLVSAFAAAENNVELRNQTKFPRTYYLNKKDGELANAAQNVRNLANANVAELEDYGILPATLTAFQAQITAYSNKVAAPRNAEAQQKSDNAQLELLFKDAFTILKQQLDGVASFFMTSNSAFYSEYRNNRDIEDTITIHSGIEGEVRDIANDNFLADVIVSVTVSVPVEGADDEIQTYSTTTGTDGKYSLDVPKSGVHTVKFSRAGYLEKQVAEVRIKRGKRPILDVKMTAGS